MTRTGPLLCLAILSIGLLLAACASPTPSTSVPGLPPDATATTSAAATRPPASATAEIAAAASNSPTATVVISAVEDLAQAFIAAYEAERPGDYLGLFSDDAIYLDNSIPYRSQVVADPVRSSGSYVRYLFTRPNFGMKFHSHIVARDGRFVALTGTYTNTGKDGNPASVPIVVILEVKAGKIIREDWYYDNTPFV